MSASPVKLTYDTIQAIINASVGIGLPLVTPGSTSTDIYRMVNPVAHAAARAGADAEKALLALSWLGAVRRQMDNLAREINVERVPGETDDSLRVNGPKIFTPGDRPSTIVDPDLVQEENDQVEDFHVQTDQQVSSLIRTKAMGPGGSITDKPCLGPRVWEYAAFRLGELYDYLASLADNYVVENSEDIGYTDWAFIFEALRVPGVRDAQVEISGMNELTLWVLLDERPFQDGRGRRKYAIEGEVLPQVQTLAQRHLPKPDRFAFRPPTLLVRAAQVKPFLVRASFSGTATSDEVQAAVLDYVYENKRIGLSLEPSDLVAAALATTGVTTYAQADPSDASLKPSAYQVLSMGLADLVQV